MATFSTVAAAIASIGGLHPDNGYTFQDMSGRETFVAFPAIDREASARGAAFQARGIGKGDRVGLVIADPQDFVLAFFGLLRIGAVPVPLYPPLSMGNLDAYADRTARVLRDAEAKLLVTGAKLQNVLWQQVDRVESLQDLVLAERLRGLEGRAEPTPIAPEDLAFLQYTSGSTSDPKGVMVTHASLVANCRGIMEAGLKMDPHTDLGVSWLPLYHDMGLIGFVIAPVLYGISIVFIPTLRFLRRPNTWLGTIAQHRATITFAPNFAYALAAKRARPEHLEDWDLSSVKALGCGAEPIHPETMRHFTDLFHTHCGLPRHAILPAYGMAEATLAITLKPLADRMITTVVDAERFQGEGVVAPPRDGAPTLEHVACGVPFPEHEVCVKAPDGTVLPDGTEGELCVRGPSVTPGYFNNPDATRGAWRDGWLHTGDLGFLQHGQVYVTGRVKDLIILNGRNVHPQSVEWAASEVDGVRKGNVVAFSRPGADSEELVVVLETRADDRDGICREVAQAVRRELSIQPAEVVCLAPGALPKTSSGKLQRRKTRQQYLSGSLGKVGTRTPGSTDRLKLASHMARSLFSRAKAAIRG